MTTTSATQHAGVTNPRGNVTTISRWLLSSNTALSTTNAFDDTGNVLTSTDPKGNITSFEYSSSFDFAYLTKVTMPSTGAAHIVSATYDFYTGLKLTDTDQNQNQTSYAYDSMLRLSQVGHPDSGWQKFVYTSATQQDFYTGINDTTPSSACSSCVHSQITEDGYGRVTNSALVNDPEGQANVVTSYDANGRVHSATNPYRSTSDATYGITTVTYDALNRVTTVTKPDTNSVQNTFGSAVSATQQCSTSIYGNGFPSLTTDEAGKKRQFWTDGFGRLIETDEPDSNNSFTLASCYQYDILNNLIAVVQVGGDSTSQRTRSYAYDSLSRRTSARNSEANATTYSYLTAGGAACSGDPSLPCSSTDGRSVTSTYAYDALNRLTAKTFSDGITSSISYFYDQATYNGLTIANGVGLRTGMSDASGTVAWSYDKMGRVTAEQRTLTAGLNPAVTKSFSFTYNPGGLQASITYPSGHKVDYTYSNAARPVTAKDIASGYNYALNATYWPTGDLHTVVFGNDNGSPGTTLTHNFNNRLEVSAINAISSSQTILDLAYSYADAQGHNNNGSVYQETNNLDSTRNQAFTYDQLNRLASAQTPNSANSWGNNYVYDNWGNLLQKNAMAGKVNAEALSQAVDTQNHVTGMTYDLAGGLVNSGSHAYTYDAEGHGLTAGSGTYVYDGDGLRVKRTDSGNSGNNTLYWRGGGIPVLAQTDLTGGGRRDFIFFAGMRIALLSFTSGNHDYFYSDRLGSTRAIASHAGDIIAWWADYFPWGEVSQISENVLSNEYRFGGQEYDYETEHYYFPFRHYSPQRGTFMTTDPNDASGNLGDPQSLGRYSYAGNNPTNNVDPLGLTDCPQGKTCDFPFPPGNPANGCSPSDASCGGDFAFGTDVLGAHNFHDPFGDPFFQSEQRYDSILTTGWDPELGRFVTSAEYFFTGVNNSSVVEQQKELAAIQFGEQACAGQDPYAIASCIQQTYNGVNDNPELIGGNYNFSYANVTINGQSVAPSDFGCAFSRCGVFDSLHFNNAAGTFHVDTANPFFVPVGSFTHLIFDVIGGNWWWRGGIPRPWWRH